MRGVFDAEGPLAPPLLALAPYNNRYLHTVNRCGRRLATNFLINGSTSSISMACCIMVKAQFETLIFYRSRRTRAFLEALITLYAMALVSLGPQAW